MGLIFSYLYSTNQDQQTNDDEDEGVTVRSLLLQVPESSSGEQQSEQWDAILQRIQNHSEEAALFCHSQESSRELSSLKYLCTFLDKLST